MFYNPYTLWNIYIMMRTIHGVYITYSFFAWFLGSTSATFFWLVSFVYNPYEVKQIEDKKKQEIPIILLDDPD
jgi:hypothetical protein